MTEENNKLKVPLDRSIDDGHWPHDSSDTQGAEVLSLDQSSTESTTKHLASIQESEGAQLFDDAPHSEIEAITGTEKQFDLNSLAFSSLEQDQLDDLERSQDHESSSQEDIAVESSNDADRKQLDLSSTVEAILFATSKPLKVGDILEILADETVTTKDVSEVISSLLRFYKTRQGGFRLENIRGGYQFQTVPEAGDIMEKMFSSRPRPISRAAQETLAIIAYRQPVTRADIEFIRGVDAGSIMKNLLERNLIKCVGRKEDSGRPMLFGTTEEFLSVYGLNDLRDLPPLESFQPSHEIMKNAMQSIEEGDQLDDTHDFVGNYDEHADLADELEPTDGEVFEADFPSSGTDKLLEIGTLEESVIETLEEALDETQEELFEQPFSPRKPQRIKGASKIDKQGSETTPQGVFLGGIDGGFNDDEIKEENEY